jgi:riboflavin biosynthesis pyrimidine reductase
MLPSVDGRIVADRWKLSPGALAEYERTARTFKADAWMIGPHLDGAVCGARQGARAKDLRVGWRAVDDEHVVTVLTEQVSDDYLAFLRNKGVSYFFGGKREVNLKRVLEKLHAALGIERLLLEGGGGINGSFLEADLIDELSVLVAPVADGGMGTPSLFDAKGQRKARRLELLSVKKRPGDVVWLRYAVKR